MSVDPIELLVDEICIKPGLVLTAVALLGERATILFIVRNRKEATSSQDEVAISAVC